MWKIDGDVIDVERKFHLVWSKMRDDINDEIEKCGARLFSLRKRDTKGVYLEGLLRRDNGININRNKLTPNFVECL